MTATDPGTKAPSPISRRFERKIGLARSALLFEQVWPRAWILIGLAALFIALSLAGLWTVVTETQHKAILAAFALAALATLISIVRLRLPDRAAGIRRMERVTGIGHRPASSYEDTLTLGATDATTRTLWQAHRQRLAGLIARLRVGRPEPRADQRDPFAVRALAMLSVLVLGVIVGDSAADRIWSAFRFGPLTHGLSARLDAWVAPPAYTGKPPVMLADGGLVIKPLASGAGAGPHVVPDRSQLIVRSVGTEAALTLEFKPADGGAVVVIAPPAPAATPEVAPVAGAAVASPASDLAEIRYEIRSSGTVRALLGGREQAAWPFQVTPDLPPKIALTKPPERSPRGSLRLNYKVEDDYGVISAEARVVPLKPKDDTSRTAWAREPRKTGPRRPFERPPAMAIQLPKAYPKTAEGLSLHEIGDHLWAGQPVRLTLQARDLAGQTGRSEPIEITLPERRFAKPLARAVIEQRRRLAADARDAKSVARALDALTIEPDGFIKDLQVYLGLRSAYRRLVLDTRRDAIRTTLAQLWSVALRIEDGNLSDAERALRAAQEKLQEALKNGASDEEIRQLMQELRQALAQFLEQMQRNADGRPMDPPRGLDPNSQTLSSRDLERMLRDLENMARSGDRDSAQQMLSELRDLLDRLQSGRMADQGQNQQMNKLMDEFSKLLGEEQQLLDETFRRQQQGGENSGNELGDRQQGLRDMLGRLEQGLKGLGMSDQGQLGGAGEAMREAEQALRRGDMEGGAEAEARALEQLRQGAREMAQQMMRRMPSRYGANGSPPELDPLGRPPNRTDGADPGTGVKIPDQIDTQRAREILEELRRRLGEQTRPQGELDYLDRLLRRF